MIVVIDRIKISTSTWPSNEGLSDQNIFLVHLEYASITTEIRKVVYFRCVAGTSVSLNQELLSCSEHIHLFPLSAFKLDQNQAKTF